MKIIPADPSRRAVALFLAAMAAVPARAFAAGMAPGVRLDGPEGLLTVDSFKGRAIYLDFWASWCGPCRLSFPFMNAMQSKYGPRGLDVVAVNLDGERSDADAFLAAFPSRFTIAFDPGGESAQRFGVTSMPCSFMIDREGQVVAKHSGFRDDDRGLIESHIVQALGGGRRSS